MCSVRKISESERIVVSIHRNIRPWEYAINRAREDAAHQFGIGDCGHSSLVDEWERSCCSIVIRFVEMEIHGGCITFKFTAWCEKYEED